MKDKVRIGIVARRTIEKENRPFFDKYIFVNNFIKRLDKAGAIPYGILFPDGKFKEEYLDIYDGFFFHSGPYLDSFQLATIHYAIKHNKPILGICLGSQAIGAYSYVIDELEKMGITPTYESIINFFEPIKLNEELFLKKVKGHDQEPTFYNNSIPKAKHNIYLSKHSHLYDIYKQDIISEPSLHNWVIRNSGKNFEIVGESEEGYIEAIEYKDKNHFIVGVQFHAELENQNDILFNRFIEKARKTTEQINQIP